MASNGAKRVRANVGRAKALRPGDGGNPPRPEPLVPDFPSPASTDGEPRCAALAEGGIRTAGDMIRFNGVMITDILRKRLSSGDAQQITGANRLSLRAAELQARYGRQVGPNGDREFVIDDSVPARPALIAS